MVRGGPKGAAELGGEPKDGLPAGPERPRYEGTLELQGRRVERPDGKVTTSGKLANRHSRPGIGQRDPGFAAEAAALAQVGELRAVVAAAALGLAGELGEGDHRDVQLLGELLHAAAVAGGPEVAVCVFAAGPHHLEAAPDQPPPPFLCLEPPRL